MSGRVAVRGGGSVVVVGDGLRVERVRTGGGGVEVHVAVESPDAPDAPPNESPRRGKPPRGRAKLFRRVRRWAREHGAASFMDAMWMLAERGLDSEEGEEP